jgi:hypothetical protein
MSTTIRRGRTGSTLGVLAVAVALVGFVGPGAVGVDGSSSRGQEDASTQRSGSSAVVRVGRSFSVAPHSLATNQIVRCPRGTRLTGGGTSLIGEPAGPRTAPVIYTNGPVGNILPGEQQSWGSEVANPGPGTFHYRQFALCLRSDD